MSGLRELEERRVRELRLTPDRALASLDETHDFVRARGLLTRTPDSALPSFFGACHEEPYLAGRGGFAEWPATKYPWYFDLARRPDIHELWIHNGKSMLLSDDTRALADPILRAELARVERADPDWTRVLGHLANAGPSAKEDLHVELGLKPKEVKLVLSPLLRVGAVVRRGDAYLRYDDAYPEPSPDGGLDDLVVAAVRAAVVATEREIERKWFSWRWLFEPGFVERLVADGRLERPEPGFVTAPGSA
ncbi:MAG TPA: hypothetical protein VF101_09625 [Gaiellaceae bacterium]